MSDHRSFFHNTLYLDANLSEVTMQPVFKLPVPSTGQFVLEPVGDDFIPDKGHLRNSNSYPFYVCLFPGDNPRLLSLPEDQWKDRPSITSVINIYKSGFGNFNIALYFTVKENSKIYNYYLVPQSSDNYINITRKDVTKLNDSEIQALNYQFRNFTYTYRNPGVTP